MRALAPALAVLGLCSACASAAAPVARHESQPGRSAGFVFVLQRTWPFSQVELVDAGGRVVRIIARRVFAASVSPDGKLVALGEKHGLYVERTSGSRPRLLVRWPSVPSWEGVETPVWSPDGKQLLVSVSSSSRLAAVSVATGRERILPAAPGRPSVDPLGWSGPADEILFEAGSGQFAESLLVASPAGVSPRAVYSQDDSDQGAPYASLSPDGKWIAFTAEGLHADPYYPFGVVDVASGKTTPIDNIHGFVETPVWSPDSSRFVVGGPPLAVFSNRGVRLGSLQAPSATPVAWTGAGLYLEGTPRAGSTAAMLFLVPTGRKAAEPVLSLRLHWNLLQLVPIG